MTADESHRQILTVRVIGPHADAAALQFPTYAYPAWRDATFAMARGEFGTAVGVEPRQAAWNDALLSPVRWTPTLSPASATRPARSPRRSPASLVAC